LAHALWHARDAIPAHVEPLQLLQLAERRRQIGQPVAVER
jgi:hypothetical protein